MRFAEMPYSRPDAEGVKAALAALTERLKAAGAYAEAKAAFLEKEESQKDVMTMSVLASIRHSIDTRDEFYDAEMKF